MVVVLGGGEAKPREHGHAALEVRCNIDSPGSVGAVQRELNCPRCQLALKPIASIACVQPGDRNRRQTHREEECRGGSPDRDRSLGAWDDSCTAADWRGRDARLW